MNFRASQPATLVAIVLASFTHMPASHAVLATPGVSVTTEASYQSLSSGPATSTGGNPGTALSTSRVGPGGGGIGDLGLPGHPSVQSHDEAIAEGRALLPGTVGSYSHAGGFSPSTAPPGGVSAKTTARQATQWMATSSDPNVTTVGIDVLAFFDGTLLTGDFAGVGAGDLVARVDASLHADTAAGDLYDFVATAALDDVTGFSASANWSGDFTSSVNATGSVRQSTVDFQEFIDDAFFVNVNEVFSWEVVLETSGFAAGPFELWAIADFFNTGGFDLSVDTPGVSLEQVGVIPIPAALPLFATACALFGAAHRRRAG